MCKNAKIKIKCNVENVVDIFGKWVFTSDFSSSTNNNEISIALKQNVFRQPTRRHTVDDCVSSIGYTVLGLSAEVTRHG